MPNEFGFELALKHLKEGRKVKRKGWAGTGVFIKLQMTGEESKMSLPYIYMNTRNGELVPWLASQSDLLENDWYVTYNVEDLKEGKGHA